MSHSVATQINESGILYDALNITQCRRSKATHFALCHGERIKFLINLHSGIAHIQTTVAAYNKKLAFLLHTLPFIPWRILEAAGLGYFAHVTLHPDIEEIIPPKSKWNVLVGTYDPAQKIVLQCYSSTNSSRTYAKVGNRGSDLQMENEIRFLREARYHNTYEVPHMKSATLMQEGAAFNILVTEEFKGKKIPPILSEEIYRIAQEIAGEPTFIDGIPYTFSHGDFAPWNIRKNGKSYTIFDWEHCDMRPIGYDLVYFIIMTEIALHKRNFNEAYDLAIERINFYNPKLNVDKELVYKEFTKTTKSLQF